ARTPALSPSLLKMMSEAWTIASIDFGASTIRSGVTIVALLSSEDLGRMVREISREIEKIPVEALRQNLPAIVAASRESASAADHPPPARPAPPGGGKTPNLDQYTVNLTQSARDGKIDPVLARDFEIRQVVDILTRRRQNNPILVGEAGVGKTAV